MQYKKYATSKIDGIGSFFDILSIGTFLSQYKETSKEIHTYNLYIILWLLKGEDAKVNDFKEDEIKNDILFFLSQKQLYQFMDLGDTEGFVIIFSEDFFEKMSNNTYSRTKVIFTSFKTASVCTLNNKSKTVVWNFFCLLLYEYQECKGSFGHIDNLVSLLSILLVDLQRFGNWDRQIESLKMKSDYYNYLMFVDCIEGN